PRRLVLAAAALGAAPRGPRLPAPGRRGGGGLVDARRAAPRRLGGGPRPAPLHLLPAGGGLARPRSVLVDGQGPPDAVPALSYLRLKRLPARQQLPEAPAVAVVEADGIGYSGAVAD